MSFDWLRRSWAKRIFRVNTTMLVLRCTRKLLKELGVTPSESSEPTSVLGAWHANLLRIERRKCVLFTNDQTLYSVFVPCLRKPQFEQIADVFGQALFRSLRLTEFSQTQIETILDNLDPLRSGRTNSRSVLGSMNDLAYQLQWMIAALGGLGRCAIDVINQQLNRIPMGTIKPHVYSVDALQACLGEYL